MLKFCSSKKTKIIQIKKKSDLFLVLIKVLIIRKQSSMNLDFHIQIFLL